MIVNPGRQFGFYRAMHLGLCAKRGLAIARRLSVRSSVTLVIYDHTGLKSRRLIAGQLAQHLRSS